jgi:hypothetical protein
MPGIFRPIDAASLLGAGGRLNGFLFDENLPRRLIFTPSLPVTSSTSPGKSPSDATLCQPFDHTSVLQFLEKVTGVGEPNISDWRRKTLGDLTAAFRLEEARSKPPTLPDTAGPLNVAHAAIVQLPAPSAPLTGQTMPIQEEGERKRVPT